MVSALAQAVTKSGNVVAVGVFLFIIFAVSGVQMFSGTFHHCTNPAVETRAGCSGTFVDPETGLEAEAVWQHLIGSHFDTVLDAVVTLFEISTMVRCVVRFACCGVRFSGLRFGRWLVCPRRIRTI